MQERGVPKGEMTLVIGKPLALAVDDRPVEAAVENTWRRGYRGWTPSRPWLATGACRSVKFMERWKAMTARREFLMLAASSVMLKGVLLKGAATIRIAHFDVAGKATGVKAVEKITKSDAEWKARLSPEQYYVTRQKGTERAGTGKYANNHADGVYSCVCCGTPLFDSKRSSNQAPAGRVSGSRLRKRTSLSALTKRMAWYETRSLALAVTDTWGTCSTTARSRLVYAIA